jgi:cellulose synthase (UDP-forming)
MLAALRWAAWGLSATVALTMLMQPVSVQAQLLLGITIIIAMLVLWTFFASISIARQLFIAFGSFVVVRYVYWRATSTLPPLSDPVGFGFGFTLLLAELYCFLILAISLIVNADPLSSCRPTTKTTTFSRPPSRQPKRWTTRPTS